MFLCFHGNCSINRLLPQQVSQLVQEVSAKEQKLLPKKKFAFKSRKKTSQPQTKEAEGREGGGGGGGGERGEGGRERGEGGRERGEGVGSNIQLKNLVGFRDRKDEKLLMSVSCKNGTMPCSSWEGAWLVHLF